MELRLAFCGRQDCADMHSWGPGMRKSYIIHFILRGAGYLECGGQRYRVERGHSFAIFPFTTVRYYPDRDDPWEYTWVDFTGPQAGQAMADAGFTPEQPVRETAAAAATDYGRICALDFAGTQRRTAEGLLQTILGAYADAWPAGHTAQNSHREELGRLISANYHKANFGVESLCRQLHSSRATVYRACRAQFGMAPQAYILRYRLRQSARMLHAGASVKQAAFSCGFSDPFYYSRQFKAAFGMAPSVYKARPEENS